jgi:hypothetical protein
MGVVPHNRPATAGEGGHPAHGQLRVTTWESFEGAKGFGREEGGAGGVDGVEGVVRGEMAFRTEMARAGLETFGGARVELEVGAAHQLPLGQDIVVTSCLDDVSRALVGCWRGAAVEGEAWGGCTFGCMRPRLRCVGAGLGGRAEWCGVEGMLVLMCLRTAQLPAVAEGVRGFMLEVEGEYYSAALLVQVWKGPSGSQCSRAPPGWRSTWAPLCHHARARRRRTCRSRRWLGS